MPLEYASNAALTGDFDEKVQLISDTLRRPVCEDAVLRRFCVLGRRAALFYIDGMADDNKLLRGVIAPCQQARNMEWPGYAAGRDPIHCQRHAHHAPAHGHWQPDERRRAAAVRGD